MRLGTPIVGLKEGQPSLKLTDFSTLRPAGFACQHAQANAFAFQHFSKNKKLKC